MSKASKSTIPTTLVDDSVVPEVIVKEKKRKAKEVTEVAAPAPVAVATLNESSTPPPAEKKARKSKAVVAAEKIPDDTELVTEPDVVEIETEAEAGEAGEDEDEEEEEDVFFFLTKTQKQIDTLSTSIGIAKSTMKNVKKHAGKQSKLIEKLQKALAKKKVRKQSAAGAGIHSPYLLSDGLYALMGAVPGTGFTRGQVTDFLHKYFKTHGLQGIVGSEKMDKRDVTLNQPLIDLFTKEKVDAHIAAKGKVTYFNMQTLLKEHYLARIQPTSAVVDV